MALSKKKARGRGGTTLRRGKPAKPADISRPDATRDRRIITALCRWFAASARPLPWRATPPLPYPALVSEFMLQQTQVSRVLEKFTPFLTRFPDPASLASAPEGDVLGLWSGLGYYRRARSLHAAAKAIMNRHAGEVPSDAAALRDLPGIGRYTAGAIASIVFGKPEPIVDGNVARVLLRVDGRELSQGEGMAWAWERASALVKASRDPGAFNEALMELGATVCTPRAPRCTACPVSRTCAARRDGTQEEIPRPKARIARKPLYCAAVLSEDARGRILVEQRGDSGMWAGLWQAPTLESGEARPTRRAVEAWIGAPVHRTDRFAHGTTHRDVSFEVWTAQGPIRRPGAVWRTRSEIVLLGLSNPMRRVLLSQAPGAPTSWLSGASRSLTAPASP